MSDKHTFFLAHNLARRNAMRAIADAPKGYRVTVQPPKRTDGQNERFHAIVGDIAKSGLLWAGKKRSAAEWKVLLVSGHATATKEGSEMVPGLEGEFVNIRESTAIMSIRRGASLIEYATAFAIANGVALNDPRLMPEEAFA